MASPEPVRFSIARLLFTGIACGLAYPFVGLLLIGGPLWLVSAQIVLGVALPSLWILLPEIRARGFHSISVMKLVAVACGFIAVCAAALLVLGWALLLTVRVVGFDLPVD